ARAIEGWGVNIRADAVRLGQLGKQRQQQRAGAGAEIGDAQVLRLAPLIAERGQRRLDHGFALRARQQRFAVDLEPQAPKFLAADDARDRLPPHATPRHPPPPPPLPPPPPPPPLPPPPPPAPS